VKSVPIVPRSQLKKYGQPSLIDDSKVSGSNSFTFESERQENNNSESQSGSRKVAVL
jgi:hypothetical protein